MRVLFAARLSRFRDGQTGLDSQEKEVLRWAEHHGHEIIGIAADYKSGKSNLWDRRNLKPWVTDPEKLAQYDAIVALKVDRLTRADDEGVDAMKAWARKNAKTILISSAEVRFPSEGMEGAQWDMYIRMAHAEWLAIQERYIRMTNSKHDAGSVVGKPPWGYEIMRTGDIKALVPSAEGRVWVPRIFGWVAEGKGTMWVCKELERQGVEPATVGGRWAESAIIAMIKRPTYSGARPRNNRTALPVEPLVSRVLQDRAISALTSRARLGRSGTVAAKPLLAKLLCGHPDCPGKGEWPMYKINGEWYRCAGRAPQRRGCGAPMVRMDTLDNLVLGMSEYWFSRPYVAQVFVTGNDAGMEAENLRSEMAELIRRADVSEIPAIAADYGARIAKVEAEGSVAPHWENIETGQSEGDHLRTLDLDGQRAYLARKDIKAWKDEETVCVTVDGFLARTGGPSIIAALIS